MLVLSMPDRTDRKGRASLQGSNVTSTTSSASNAPVLPDYAPVPPSALGPAVNAQGFYVGRVQRNLYWVTDGTYQAAFLTTKEGVVLFDAPPASGTTCSAPSTRSRPPTACPTR